MLAHRGAAALFYVYRENCRSSIRHVELSPTLDIFELLRLLPTLNNKHVPVPKLDEF